VRRVGPIAVEVPQNLEIAFVQKVGEHLRLILRRQPLVLVTRAQDAGCLVRDIVSDQRCRFARERVDHEAIDISPRRQFGGRHHGYAGPDENNQAAAACGLDQIRHGVHRFDARK
jgi:hypothetical protein